MNEVSKFNPIPSISDELGIPAHKVQAVIKLLGDANTVPFIARYRKEMTGDLDEVQIRNIDERHTYLVELDKRREAVLSSIEEQGKLTDELRAKILACTTKSALEDLYLPYKPKRRTRATIAKERGLEPLAALIMEQPASGDPQVEAASFVDPEKEVPDAEAALAGARDIVAEWVAENAEVRQAAREAFAKQGLLHSEPAPDMAEAETKFKDYYDFQEPVATIPSHRFLAVRRGERENVLRFRITIEDQRLIDRIAAMVGRDLHSPFGGQMQTAVEDSYHRLLSPSVESDVRIDLKMRSDREAVDVFASNMRNLLLAAPFGTKPVIGVDPGLRTGCKCAALDHTGKYLDTITFNIVRGEGAMEGERQKLIAFVKRFSPAAIAVGNGTGGRETERFVKQALSQAGIKDVIVIQVNESGASVYSASEIAGKEFPQLDLTIRGAISIARRLQDPLAELVKIDPKSIGVGQYQHDVHQPLLGRKLDEVVESCVNHVGVELNTASAPLLAQVAGIGPAVAGNIVQYRETTGAFTGRKELLKVAKLGPRTFEQAAGFLRIRGASHPLDASAVHPERYQLVERMAADLGVSVPDLVGNPALADKIDVTAYVDDTVGEPTLRDIIAELAKPGRDPRDSFEAPAFRDDVNTMEDLVTGMELEGVVTNVTAFGAFVDVGVHQDGLVHVSELADRFVRDPAEVVKVGDKIKVRVLDVDLGLKRISLSARAEGSRPRSDGGGQRGGERQRGGDRGAPRGKKDAGRGGQKETFSYNPFADLLKKR